MGWEYIHSVVGLNFDFVVLNLIKQSFYLAYNATLYFSSDVQKQYFDKYGYGEVRLLFPPFNIFLSSSFFEHLQLLLGNYLLFVVGHYFGS